MLNMCDGIIIPGGYGIYDESTHTWDYSNVPYSENKATLNTAFGSSNCAESSTEYVTLLKYNCSLNELYAYADERGIINASFNAGIPCAVYTGHAYCHPK